MKLQFTGRIMKELKEKNISEDQLINNLYIGKYTVNDLEFSVNKNVDGTIIVDSLDNFDLFGDDIVKTVEIDDFEI